MAKNGYSQMAIDILPVAKPGLVVTGMFAFLNAWDDYLLTLILTSSARIRAMPIAFTMADWSAIDEVFNGKPTIKDGYLVVNDAPGLGCQLLNEEAPKSIHKRRERW